MINKLRVRLHDAAQKQPRLMEILRFCFTGGICFAVDFGIMTLLKSGLGLHYLIANAVGFIVSVALNYVLCLRWVFHGAKDSGAGTQAAFLITSAAGLAINEGCMALLVSVLGMHYMVAKVIANIVVMVWNYVTKRRVLTGKSTKEASE